MSTAISVGRTSRISRRSATSNFAQIFDGIRSGIKLLIVRLSNPPAIPVRLFLLEPGDFPDSLSIYPVNT
ncbi:hypothetical protein AB0I54_46340 [Streptomyces sp. NPDC050625]|uniref:hypothetical protein n=1 Tax=Streptomyces sp. NPDC050625 TaxID=3154629 RepID=UPI00344663CE